MSGERSDGLGEALTRRELVAVALSAMGLAALGGCEATTGPSRRPELPPTLLDLEQLLETFFARADASGLRAVGQVYLQRFENDETALKADLAEVVGVIAGVDRMDVAVETLENAIRTDFATERRALVEGWQLSLTEARLCGVMAFLA